MNLEAENLNEPQKQPLLIADVSGSAIVENEHVVLYFQFDDGEPIEALKCNGEKFTMEILPVENNFVTFTDGKKTMKLFVRHCH
ncbi:hypothetical protein [Flavobacterium sp.]|uniref:hypothetical protein n=1 Tax=Flavobacterium sp. TaxID=239 RepID=UPI0038FC8687